nr:P1 [Blackberry virus Y]
MPTRYRGADRYGNLGYDKVLQSKADAAKRRGLLFDHGSETYECPRCGEIWRNLDDYMAEGGKMHPKKCLPEECDSDEEQISSCNAALIHEKWGDLDSDTSSKLSEFYKEPSILTYTTRTHCVVEKMRSMTAPQCIEDIVGVRLHGRTAWFFSKDPTLQYGHHPIYYDTHPWNDELDKYLGGAKYNTALVQVYDGTRDLPYHKDDEPCYDITNNPIRTVNVTGTGDLCISKDKRRLYETIPMTSGTVITFPATMQENFYHAVRNPSAGRISITFRNQIRTVERQVAHSANKRWVPIVEARVTTNESRRGDNKQFQEAQSKLQTKTTINFGEFAAEVDGYYPTLSQDHKPALPKIIPELGLPTVDFIYVGNMRVPIDFKKNNVPAIVDTARHVAKIIDSQALTSEPIKVFTEQREVVGNVVTCTGTGFSVADAKEAKALLNGLMYNRASNLFICPSCSDAAVLPEALLTLEHKRSCELASMKKISLARNMQVHVKQEAVARLISQQNSISVPIATLSSCVRGSADTTQVSLHIDEEDSIVDAIHLPNDFITCDHEHAFETDSASDNDVETMKKSEKRRKRRKRNPPPVRQVITRAPVSNIICDVILTCLETQIPVEFIGKSCITFKPVRVGPVHTVGIQLKHQLHKTGFEVDDLPDRETTSDIILAATRALRRLRHAHSNAQQVHNSDITFGTSGAILPWSWLAHDVIVEGPVQDSLVVRGRNVVSGHVTNALNLQQDCLADDYLQY